MAKNKVVKINASVRLVNGFQLEVTKRFAENNLSKECLSRAAIVTKTHYKWSMDDTGVIVVFELPSLFKMSPQDISTIIYLNCKDYLTEKKITVDDFLKVLNNNNEKKIIY